MAVECYAKTDLSTDGRKIRCASALGMVTKIGEWPKHPQFWLCHLRIIEVPIVSPNLMTTIGCMPGFEWSILKQCVDVSWYEQQGLDMTWEDIPDACSYFSQDDPEEGVHTVILPFAHCIRRDLLVRKEELRYLFPECFSEPNTLDQILDDIDVPDTSMPTEILADYIRDRL